MYVCICEFSINKCLNLLSTMYDSFSILYINWMKLWKLLRHGNTSSWYQLQTKQMVSSTHFQYWRCGNFGIMTLSNSTHEDTCYNTGAKNPLFLLLSVHNVVPLKLKLTSFVLFHQFCHYSSVDCCVYFIIIANLFQNSINCNIYQDIHE